MPSAEDGHSSTNNKKDEAAVSPPTPMPDPGNDPTRQPETAEQLREVEREMTGFERSTLRFARLAFGVSVLAAIFVGLQWHEMRSGSADTHDLAVAAGKQADRMKDLADRMKDQADRTKVIAEQAVIQAKPAGMAAEAAKSAAHTSQDTLHVSERAYLVISPTLDFKNKLIHLSLRNTGRIPSGAVEVIVHETAFSGSGAFVPNEFWWKRHTFASMSPIRAIDIGVPSDSIDVTRLNSKGDVRIVVAGSLSYNDGFSNTPTQTQPFCALTVYDVPEKRPILTDCNPTEWLGKMKKQDGYPNNERPY